MDIEESGFPDYLVFDPETNLKEVLENFNFDRNKDPNNNCTFVELWPDKVNTVGLYLLVGSWNKNNILDDKFKKFDFYHQFLKSHQRRDTLYHIGLIKLQNEDDDNNDDFDELCRLTNRIPPECLPALLLAIRRSTMERSEYQYISTISAETILRALNATHPATILTGNVLKKPRQEIHSFLQSFGLQGPSLIQPRPSNLARSKAAIRIFVAGDRMSVGKTSICLGILGSLVQQMGYEPNRLAYIKPATQNEKPQLIQHYCEGMGISCQSVGPIVYYRGFTRAYLAGETETSAKLLAKVESAVDEIAKDKDIVIVDGVGFPAVGSICGTDNASVAVASSYPVTDSNGKINNRNPMGILIVGGPGVGSAVDAFNLNATYFEERQIPVMGAIFNKLSLEGFYSLENCKKEINLYFGQNEHQRQHKRKAFGFCPLFPQMGNDNAIDHVHDYIRVFGEHVNIHDLIERAAEIQYRPSSNSAAIVAQRESNPPPQKRLKVNEKRFRTREEIEAAAIGAGAAPSA